MCASSEYNIVYYNLDPRKLPRPLVSFVFKATFTAVALIGFFGVALLLLVALFDEPLTISLASVVLWVCFAVAVSAWVLFVADDESALVSI